MVDFHRGMEKTSGVKSDLRKKMLPLRKRITPASLPAEFSTFEFVTHRLRMRSFGVIRIRISDPRSHGSWYIKEADESTLVTDSSASLMYHDPSDLGSLIRIRITPKERTLSSLPQLIEYGSAVAERTKDNLYVREVLGLYIFVSRSFTEFYR